MRYAVPVGRVLFALIFIISALGHFGSQSIEHAASRGVPMAEILVPISGVLALLGGLSIALGYRARLGALLLVAFLIPVTLLMHPFWAVEDPQQAMMQRISFLKNVSMLGGALFMAYFGAGPVSVDERRPRRAPLRTREPLPT
jgi:putative oxidoreductase